MCRVLYTLARGELSGKARAVAWAITTLPEPWRTIVERSQAWRRGAVIDRAAAEPEIVRFVRWTATDGEASVTDVCGRNAAS